MAEKNLEEILVEYHRLYQLYEEASARKDDDLIVKYGGEIADFLNLNRASLNFTEDDIARLRKSLAECEISIKKSQISDRRAKEARDNYCDTLLKQTPDGKKRTAH